MLAPTAIRGSKDMSSSPLGQHILCYKPSHGFFIPSFAMYDGSSDLYDHMLNFNQAMIPNDRLLCKVLPASLKGPALAWFHKLSRRYINMFSELWVAFVSQYLCSIRHKRKSVLYKPSSNRKISPSVISQGDFGGGGGGGGGGWAGRPKN